MTETETFDFNIKPQLTMEQQAEYAALVDPDIVSKDSYRWDEEFQKELLGLLLNDKHFLIESRPLILPIYFTDEVHQRICHILFEYFDKYKTLPNKVQVKTELKEKIAEKSGEIQVHNLGELESIYLFYVPGLESRDYYRDKIVNFAKMQALRRAFFKSLESMKQEPNATETWDKIHSFLREAMTVEYNFEPGLDYFNQLDSRYDRLQLEKDNGEIFTTGFKCIDDTLDGGMKRKEMAAVMGVSGTGKSLWLKVTAVANLNKGKKVLYISLEMDEDGIAMRFDTELANFIVDSEVIKDDDKGVTVKNHVARREVVIDSIKEYINIISPDDSTRLIIKQFSGGSMDVAAFRAYYSQLSLRGFHPDIVIIDYIGEMKDQPGIPIHESRFKIVRDLRGFAVEEDILVLTALQTNVVSAKAGLKEGMLIDDESMGDSKAQARPLDALWTLNQLSDERGCHIGRAYIAKSRRGESKVAFHVQFNYDTLTIREITQIAYEQILKEHRNTTQKLVGDAVSRKVDEICTGGPGAKTISSKMRDVAYNDDEASEETPTFDDNFIQEIEETRG